MAKPATTVTTDEAVQAQAPKKPLRPVFKVAAGPARWADERIGLAGLTRPFLRKVFPDHWSFLLGEIALYSFIVLLLSGIFLTLWFKPSMGEVEYEGTYQLLRGIQMSEAYASTLNLSFDIRGGLLLRQMHHWAAMLFVAAMLTHSLRIFFTGAFRKPREINWLIGVGMLVMGLFEGFMGYSLPDDLLSGTGLRFMDGAIRATPIIGTWAEFFFFGGEFPGDLVVPRLYMVHILLLPALLLGLIAAHLALVVYHKHTQFPGPGRTEDNVVGYPVFPVYAAKAGGFFFIVFGVRALQPGRGDRWVPARLVHGLRRGRHPDHAGAGLGMAHRIDHLVLEHLHPAGAPHGAAVRRHGDLPVHRGLGDRRQVRAPPARSPTERPDPDRLRRGGHDLVCDALGRRWQRHHRDHLRHLTQLGHLLPPSRGVRRSGGRVPADQADLHRAAALG
jgi:hypothetical protein